MEIDDVRVPGGMPPACADQDVGQAGRVQEDCHRERDPPRVKRVATGQGWHADLSAPVGEFERGVACPIGGGQ